MEIETPFTPVWVLQTILYLQPYCTVLHLNLYCIYKHTVKEIHTNCINSDFSDKSSSIKFGNPYLTVLSLSGYLLQGSRTAASDLYSRIPSPNILLILAVCVVKLLLPVVLKILMTRECVG